MRSSGSGFLTVLGIVVALFGNEHFVGHATPLRYATAEFVTDEKVTSAVEVMNPSPFPARTVRLVIGHRTPDIENLFVTYGMLDAGENQVLIIDEIPANTKLTFRVVADRPKPGTSTSSVVQTGRWLVSKAFWAYGEIERGSASKGLIDVAMK